MSSSTSRQKTILLLTALLITLTLFTTLHFRHILPHHLHKHFPHISSPFPHTSSPFTTSHSQEKEWHGLDLGGHGGVGFGKGKPREMHGNGGEICDSFYVDDLMGCAEVVGEGRGKGREEVR